MIKLVVLDVDGVLTDGKKTYDLDGRVISKQFCDRDFTIIKKIQAQGIPVIWLSGDHRVNKEIAEKRKIPFINSAGQDKGEFFHLLCGEYKCTGDNIVYIGDDSYDMPFLQRVKYAFCPVDASEDIKPWCEVLESKSGDGCVVEMFNRLVADGELEEVNYRSI